MPDAVPGSGIHAMNRVSSSLNRMELTSNVGKTSLKCSLGGRDFKQVAGSYIEEKAFVGEVGELSREQPQQVRRAREGGNTAAAVSTGGESIDSHHAPSTCSVPGITATQHLLCGVIFRDTV